MTPEEREAKVAFRLLVDRLGGLDAAAAASGRKRSALAECYSLDHPDRFPSVQMVLRLERVAERPLVTAVLARAAGHTLAGDTGRADGGAPRLLRQFVADSHEVAIETLAALDDGKIDEAEARTLLGGLDAAERSLAAARAAIRRRSREG